MLLKIDFFPLSYGIYYCYWYVLGNNNQFIAVSVHCIFIYNDYNSIKNLFYIIDEVFNTYLDASDFDCVEDVYILWNI